MDTRDGPNRNHTVVEAERLLDEGRRFAARGDLAGAETWFERAVLACPIPAALNNLALVRLEHHHDPADALGILAPNLDDPLPQPYAHALAARCHAQLGNVTEARRHLDAAAGDFETATTSQPLADDNLMAIAEYTTIVLQAAGDLGDDRRVWTLHQRWQQWHVRPECDFFAGTALFNLRRFEQAARVWGRVRHREWRLLQAYAGVAELCAAGTVPPFRLPYATPREDDFKAATADAKTTPLEDVAARIVADPANLLMVLYNLFAPDAPLAQTPVEGREAMISGLVAGGGEWGERLARSLFAASHVSTPCKMAALQGLHTAGVVSLDEPVTMLVDGQSTQVALKRVELVTDPEPELDRRYREALASRDAGRVDDARRALDSLVHGDRVYAPAAVAYANILRTRGERAEARRMLELLHHALPDHPAVLYNLTAVCAEDGDYKTARRHLEAIDTDDLPPGMAEKLTALTEHLEPYLMPEYLMEHAEEEYRRQVDERPISPQTLTLVRALDQIPAQWLDAACVLYEIASPARLRRDRARQLARVLTGDPEATLRVLTRLDHDGQSRALLRVLLQNGGWTAVAAVTRRFGREDGDGYFWTEKPPASPLGRLRAACLVFVGRALVHGRRSRAAVVPAELRTALKGLLDDA